MPRGGGRAAGSLAVALAAAALALAAALSPPGDAVADWVRDRGRPAPARRPRAACPPPTGCRPAGACSSPRAARRGSSRRAASAGGSARGRAPRGRRTGASWSSGAVAGSPRSIAAGTCAGRWSRRGRSRTALWSPSGFRVAYRSGQDLRVVAGDGTGDRLPRPRHVPADGLEARRRPRARLTCRARTSTSSTSIPAARLARIRLPHVPHEIAWSADGRRLFVNLHRSLAIYDASGRRTGRIWMPRPPDASTTFVPARSGSLVAVGAAASGASSEVALMGPGARDRVLFRADGRFTRLRFSPVRPLAAGGLAAGRPVGLPAPGRDRRAPRARRAGRDAAHRLARLPAAQRLVLPGLELGLDPVHHRAQLLALALDLVVGLLLAHALEVLLARRGSRRSTRGRTRPTGSRRGCPSSPGASRRR